MQAKQSSPQVHHQLQHRTPQQLLGLIRVIRNISEEHIIKATHTYHKIRIKLIGNRHDDLLKCEHVISIAHAFRRPGYVDVAVQVSD